jgi:type IV secretory pathway VirB4 component
VLKRHTAVLGGSGSGKTTLALCIIEQLLLQGTPAC